MTLVVVGLKLKRNYLITLLVRGTTRLGDVS